MREWLHSEQETYWRDIQEVISRSRKSKPKRNPWLSSKVLQMNLRGLGQVKRKHVKIKEELFEKADRVQQKIQKLSYEREILQDKIEFQRGYLSKLEIQQCQVKFDKCPANKAGICSIKKSYLNLYTCETCKVRNPALIILKQKLTPKCLT